MWLSACDVLELALRGREHLKQNGKGESYLGCTEDVVMLTSSALPAAATLAAPQADRARALGATAQGASRCRVAVSSVALRSSCATSSLPSVFRMRRARSTGWWAWRMDGETRGWAKMEVGRYMAPQQSSSRLERARCLPAAAVMRASAVQARE